MSPGIIRLAIAWAATLAIWFAAVIACDPILTPLPATPTPTETATPSVTPTPTATPTAITYPTCLPTSTPVAGDIIIRSCLDDDGDRLCDAPIVPISLTVLLMYEGTPQFGISATTGAWGTLVLPGMLPGVYTVLMLDYDDPAPGMPGACRVPYWDNPQWSFLSAGQQEVILMRFWTLNVCSTPQATATRTPTATPIVGYSPTSTRSP